MKKEENKMVTLRLRAARERCALPVYEIAVAGKEGTAVLGKILAGLSCRLIDGSCNKKGASALAALPTPVGGEELTALLGQTVTVTTATAREMLTKEISHGVIGLLAGLPAAEEFTVGASEICLQVSCPREFLEQAENLARRYGAEIARIE